MREEWRPVVGYEGRYEVSSLGRVRRVKIIFPSKKKHGYMQVSLVDKAGVRRSLRLHRIVAEAFIPNPEELREPGEFLELREESLPKDLNGFTIEWGKAAQAWYQRAEIDKRIIEQQ